MSYIKLFIINLFVLFGLMACNQPREENEIWIGTIAGPETDLMQVAKAVAEKQYGLKLKVVEFEEYTTPNTALAEGSIDANMFQHQPFLELAIKNRGFKIESIGKTFIYPMGIYSNKIKNLNALPKGAIIAIPNDPSNGARAIRLLAKAQLITIKDTNDMQLSPKSILYNPSNYKIKELDAAQLPRVLADVDIAVINTNYAVPAGLKPNKDALFAESTDSPYANVVVVRSSDKNEPKYQKLMQALHSKEVIEKSKQLFNGYALPAWKTN